MPYKHRRLRHSRILSAMQVIAPSVADHFQATGGPETAQGNRDAVQFTDYALQANALASKVKQALHTLLRRRR